MAVNYDLNNTGPEVQSRLDQVFPNKSDIDALGVRVDGHDADIAELNNEIDALEKQDVIPVDTLPPVAEAAPKAIYRVAGEDSYTDYMVNASGDGWKELAEFSFPGIDEEPTAGSGNLVKSGGVANYMGKYGRLISQGVWLLDGYYITHTTSSNHHIYEDNSRYSLVIEIPKNGKTLSISGIVPMFGTVSSNFGDIFSSNNPDEWDSDHYLNMDVQNAGLYPNASVVVVSCTRESNPNGYGGFNAVWTYYDDEITLLASRGIQIKYNFLYSVNGSIITPFSSSLYDTAIFTINDGCTRVSAQGVTIVRYLFFSTLEPDADYYVNRNTTGVVPEGAKSCAITLSKSENSSGYSELHVIQNDLLYTRKKIYTSVDADDVNPNHYIDASGNTDTSTTLGVYTYGIDSSKIYAFTDWLGGSQNVYMINYYSGSTFLGKDYKGTGGGVPTEYTNQLIIPPEGTTVIKMNIRMDHSDYCGLQEVTYGYYDFDQMEDDIEELKQSAGEDTKLMKVIKNGSNVSVRTRLSNDNDIVITFSEIMNNITFNNVYIGSNELSDTSIVEQEHLVRTLGDSVGAFGVDSFWFLYAQHGWTIPLMTVSTQTLDSTDIGSIWVDQNNRQFTIGSVSGNSIYLLPVITKDASTQIYSASWDGKIEYPTTITHVSGATHTSQITGTSKRYDLKVQTSTDRKFVVDDVEVTENGVYYCDDFVIHEHLLEHNVGRVSTWFPTPQYDGVLMDVDRSFVIKGSSVACNMVINVQYPFKITDYRGVIPQMPLKVGDYHSYSFIPKVQKEQNSHRIDLPFATDAGTEQVYAYRNSTDLYDEDDQPERCICYLKDESDNYLVGVAGGGSLLRGISAKENHNIYVPVGQQTFAYGGSSTPNKFYPRMWVAAGFQSGIVPDSYISELCSYYVWFNPGENAGQVYWYKDGDNYIVYIHNQSAVAKQAVNLPCFMEGLSVESIIEKTSASSILTQQVISNKLYVGFSTAGANYIVIKLG